jgi:HK97 family phage portal protein
MGWLTGRRDRVETRSGGLTSIVDPVLAEWFGVGIRNDAGVSVNEHSSLGLSSFWRANAIVSGTVGTLPMHTYRTLDDGSRARVASFLDNPGGPEGLTPFEWKETVVAHAFVHGNAFLAHVFNQGGGLIGLVPIHPLAVEVKREPDAIGGRIYNVTLEDGTRRTFTMLDMTHVPSLSMDGLRGLSMIGIARNSLGTSIAGDRAAARHFGNGMLVSGLVTPEEDITQAEATEIMTGLAALQGTDNAGDIRVINRRLKFTQWQQAAKDAQFLESRQFQVEEVARWTGVPPHLLMQTEKQTSWGTGVAEQNRGLARFTLLPWTTRLEQRLSRLLASPRFVEFEYAGLEKPTPEEEIRLLLEQVNGGLLTVNEARHIRNLPAVPGGDVLRVVRAADTSPPAAPVEVTA